jgi:hypothetical protein
MTDRMGTPCHTRWVGRGGRAPGRSDCGANAKRLRAFPEAWKRLTRLDARDVVLYDLVPDPTINWRNSHEQNEIDQRNSPLRWPAPSIQTLNAQQPGLTRVPLQEVDLTTGATRCRRARNCSEARWAGIPTRRRELRARRHAVLEVAGRRRER